MIFFLGFSSSCTASQPLRNSFPPATWHCPTKHIRVGYDHSFDEHHVYLIQEALIVLRDYRINAELVETNPTVSIKRWRKHQCHDTHLGQYFDGRNYVEVDPPCFLSDHQFKVGIVHELGHWLGMRHLCDQDRAQEHHCVPEVTGVAVMNPTIGRIHLLHPSNLDITEYNLSCWRYTVF